MFWVCVGVCVKCVAFNWQFLKYLKIFKQKLFYKTISNVMKIGKEAK